MGIKNNAKHLAILKARAGKVSETKTLSFFFVRQKGTKDAVLHIDKPGTAGKFKNPTRIKQLLLKAKDLDPKKEYAEDFFSDPKALISCAGTVSRDAKGLVFVPTSTAGKAKGNDMIACLKAFKKAIGAWRVASAPEPETSSSGSSSVAPLEQHAQALGSLDSLGSSPDPLAVLDLFSATSIVDAINGIEDAISALEELAADDPSAAAQLKVLQAAYEDVMSFGGDGVESTMSGLEALGELSLDDGEEVSEAELALSQATLDLDGAFQAWKDASDDDADAAMDELKKKIAACSEPSLLRSFQDELRTTGRGVHTNWVQADKAVRLRLQALSAEAVLSGDESTKARAAAVSAVRDRIGVLLPRLQTEHGKYVQIISRLRGFSGSDLPQSATSTSIEAIAQIMDGEISKVFVPMRAASADFQSGTYDPDDLSMHKALYRTASTLGKRAEALKDWIAQNKGLQDVSIVRDLGVQMDLTSLEVATTVVLNEALKLRTLFKKSPPAAPART